MKPSHTEFQFSIIVPVHNGEKRIQACLNSILDEDLSQSEVIVIDNGSTDTTNKLLTDLEKRGVCLYKVEPPSRGLARQFGIEKAKGKIIVMVDSDCVVDQGWLKKITQPIQNGDSKLVIGQTVGLGSESWGFLAEKAEKSFLFQGNELGQRLNFTSTHFAIARSCLDLVSFDPRLKSAEDFDFSLQCLLNNIQVHYVESAIARHAYANDFKGQMQKSMSRGSWSYVVLKKYKNFDFSFQNKIRKNKGLENYRFIYTIAWAAWRLTRVAFANPETRKAISFETFYELAWQCGVFLSRCQYYFTWAKRSKFLSQDVHFPKGI